MDLARKPDFDMACRRFDAWWRRQVLDRPPVTIQVRPEREPAFPEKRHASERDRWLDVEYAVARAEAAAAVGIYLAETFPRFEPCVGPELCATLFGCDLEFTAQTSYSIPIARSAREILALKPSLDTPYWNNIRAKTDLSLERGRGRWITALPDLHTNGDLAAALRNPQDLCLDLADDPPGVRAAVDYVNSFYPAMYEDLWHRIRDAGQPCTTWTPFLSAGPAYPVSCDFICMVSPAMFQAAILPAIEGETRYLEHSIFHLDGPGALKHLDALLALPRLDAIQWVYGAGSGPARKWIDVYRRVQAAGKGIQLMADGLADAQAVAEHLRPEGVWLCPGGTYSRDEAEAFIAWAARWAAKS
jgi:hypothetical protein